MSGDDDETRTALFGYTLSIGQQLTRAADAELAAFGLTTKQWFLLAVLERFFPDRPASLTEAAERYGSSRQNVKQIALALQRRGFLTLETDPDNRATTRLVPGPRAAELSAPDQQQRARDALRALTEGLSPADRRQLLRLLRRWDAALHDQHAQGGQGA